MLPSQQSAVDLLQGQPGGVVGVVVSTLGRALILYSAMSVAGVPARYAGTAALAGAIGIEGFVLLYTHKELDKVAPSARLS